MIKKTGRFIKMDFKKWLNPKICSPHNTPSGFEHGKIYEVFLENEKSFRIFDSFNSRRVVHDYEVRALEVSLSRALIEMSKD